MWLVMGKTLSTGMYKFDDEMIISILNKKEEIKLEIKEICEEYGLIEKEICLICLPNVW